MDWRRPIDQQQPVARAAERQTTRGESWTSAADVLRRAGRDPEMLERAVEARAYTERLRNQGHRIH